MRPLWAVWRICVAVVVVFDGLRQAVFVLPRLDDAGRQARVQAWSRAVLRAMGVQLHCRGEAGAGVLLVANHVSWLDITALHAVAPRTRFVSKSTIAHWPVVGRLARSAGTLFIERERKRDALRVVHEVAAALLGGQTVGVFPEGTTGPGDVVLPFHANLLQAAIHAGRPIQPVVLRYSEPGQVFSRSAQYIGDTTLVASPARVALARGLAVHLEFLPPEEPGGIDRRALAGRLQARVAARLDDVAAQAAAARSGAATRGD